ncbi:hypothetical protein SLEP1_g22692 [Rubroshorea leprosula]|uniref:Secreted protein n=1 Tax=Rubroshorea leprosula TaxID=152421 RepID=A0AAV5JG36_9ROSI|nr:hypothetical protein SLEP1_g22692 [Rubroshorea leprosula]
MVPPPLSLCFSAIPLGYACSPFLLLVSFLFSDCLVSDKKRGFCLIFKSQSYICGKRSAWGTRLLHSPTNTFIFIGACCSGSKEVALQNWKQAYVAQ